MITYIVRWKDSEVEESGTEEKWSLWRTLTIMLKINPIPNVKVTNFNYEHTPPVSRHMRAYLQ